MSLRCDQILVPSDGSPEAEVAFAAIRPLVQAWHPEVSVLHVFEGPEEPLVPPPLLVKTCASLRATGVDAALEVRQGRPADAILEAVRARKADLVAISTHGRSGVKRLLMGSVTEELLRRADVPLLVTRPGLPAREWRRILVALDGSERAEQVLADAAILAKATNSALDFVRVAFTAVSPLGLGEVPMVLPPDDTIPYLKQAVGRAAKLGVEARPVKLEGRAATEVLKYAAQADVGLICMTTHGRSGVARLLMGSIAEELLRHAPCSVLVRRSVRVESGIRNKE